MLSMSSIEKNKVVASVSAQFCQGLAPYLASPEFSDGAEKRVVRQFVEALLYEEVVSSEQFSRTSSFQDARKFDAIYDSVLTFKLSSVEFRCVASRRVFERVRIAEGSVQCLLEGEFREARLQDVICNLETDELAKERLLGELMQTIALCRWNTTHLDHHIKSRRQLSFPQLESAITEGHLYHPSFKARTGFSLKDHRDFGPEAARKFQFQWLAVKSGQLDSAFPSDNLIFWKTELGEPTFDLLRKRLNEKGKTSLNYSLLPIHPWQINAIQKCGLAKAIEDGDIIKLGEAGDFYQATQSLRTLVNVSNPEKANVKIPLNLVSTSSHRNLQDHFVCTAPTISNWLQKIVAKDEYLQRENKLVLLSEYAGLLYKPTDVKQAKEMDGLIGAIFRESVLSKLQGGEEAVPFTAIMLVESDGRPFISQWLDSYGIEAWVNRLLEVMLIPIWHMLVHHGIAFEAHCQNLILIHRNGWPEKIVLRDFHEDMEYVQEYLSQPNHPPALEEVDEYFTSIPLDEGFNMSDLDELRELFMDTVYVLNLADLSFLLERFNGYSETQFWQKVRDQLNQYRESGTTDPARIDRIGADNPEIIVESLLKKKILNGGALDYYQHNVSNPLHQVTLADSLVVPVSQAI